MPPKNMKSLAQKAAVATSSSPVRGVADHNGLSPTANSPPSSVPSPTAPGPIPMTPCSPTAEQIGFADLASPTQQAGASAMVIANLNTAAGTPDDALDLANNILQHGIVQALIDGVFNGMQHGMGHKLPAVRKNWLVAFKVVSEKCAPVAIPHLIHVLPVVLACAGDKKADCKAAAAAAVEAFGAAVAPDVMGAVLPAVITGTQSYHNTTQLAALALLKSIATHAPDQLAALLPEVVPALADLVHDLNPAIAKAAVEGLTASATSLSNRDIVPFVPALIAAISDGEAATSCVCKLAGTTFVQQINAPALALMEPVLMRGFAAKKTATTRMCSLIVENMSKLLTDPVDVRVFAPKILPQMEKAAKHTSDPECRSVCERAFGVLTKVHADATLDDNADTALTTMTQEELEELFTKAIRSESSRSLHPDVISFLAAVSFSFVKTRCFEGHIWQRALGMYFEDLPAGDVKEIVRTVFTDVLAKCKPDEVVEEEDPAGDLCNCPFTLAYGSKVLLRDTRLHLKKGRRYGLVGPNGSGKSTLMNAIVANQIDGFPSPDELKTVFVSCDISPDHATLSVVDFCVRDPALAGIEKERIVDTLGSVGFTDAMRAGQVDSLSGGWKMKLALARAMLQEPQILLLDEPTNHLDVNNVKWVQDYLIGLDDVTSIIVSHDATFLDTVCTDIIQCDHMRLKNYRGNLSAFCAIVPEAKAYHELKASSTTKFVFPAPRPVTGVKSKGKALLWMEDCEFTYPGTEKQILFGISIKCSMLSRIAVVGPNGAGKSTMIKLLTGELEPNKGTVWKHPELLLAYVAQHAFHHIESHLEKTPNEYIRWRFEGGIDKEAITKSSLIASDEELRLRDTPFLIENVKHKVQRVLNRRLKHRVYAYEVKLLVEAPCKTRFVEKVTDEEVWFSREKLEKLGWDKECKKADDRDQANQGWRKPLTQKEVEKHLGLLGLTPEFATHTRMDTMSTSQRVKVVIAAATWESPHIIVLDEPTNYLDRESLGALADAIRDFGGGVVMISHNAEFTTALCSEQWSMSGGRLHVYGEVPTETQGKIQAVSTVTEMTDAFGNTVTVKPKKAELSRKERKAKEARKKAGIVDSDEEEEW